MPSTAGAGAVVVDGRAKRTAIADRLENTYDWSRSPLGVVQRLEIAVGAPGASEPDCGWGSFMDYDLEVWHDLFAMTGGAAATLAGLIFVAVSLNHEQILAASVLPPLAAQTLSVLIGIVLLAIAVLTPRQPTPLLAGEVLAVAAALALIVMGTTLGQLARTEKWHWRVSRLGLALLVTVPALVAGVLLAVGAASALGWLVVEVAFGFVVSAYYAWILLIEIRR